MGLKGGVGVLLAMTVVLAAFAVAGCGDDKPSYCTATSDLKTDVNQVADDATSGNFADVQADIDGVQSQAETVVDDTKADFPSETDAVDSAVNALVNAYEDLPDSPSAQDLLSLGAQAAVAVKSVDSLNDAIDSKC